jgi:hypothetical protein
MVDYSKTLIYRIISKDKLLNEFYIGHTTDLEQRKYRHLIDSTIYPNRKVYKYINENGGFGNFDFEILETHSVTCKKEAENLEEQAIKKFGAGLNYRKNLHRTRQQIIDYKRGYNHDHFICECGCSITKQNILRHKLSNKHLSRLSKQIST